MPINRSLQSFIADARLILAADPQKISPAIMQATLEEALDRLTVLAVRLKVDFGE